MNGIRIRTVVEFVFAALLVGGGAWWLFGAQARERAGQDDLLRFDETVSGFEVENQTGEKGVETGEEGDRVEVTGDGTNDDVRTLLSPPERETLASFAKRRGIRLGETGRVAESAVQENPPPPQYHASGYGAQRGPACAECSAAGRLGTSFTKGGTGESQAQKELRAFGNAAGGVIKETVGDGGKEAEILNALIRAAAPETLAAVRALAERYEALAEKLNNADVPPEAAETRRALAAAYGGYAAALNGLATPDEKGRVPVERFQTYSDAVRRVAEAFIETAQFLAAEGVRFAPDEPGAIFALP